MTRARSFVTPRGLCAAALAVLCLSAGPARAVNTQTWSRDADMFRAGTLEGTVVTPDGLLLPAPAARVIARPEPALIWSVLDAGGDVLAGAGEKAGLLLAKPGTGEGGGTIGGGAIGGGAIGGGSITAIVPALKGAGNVVALARGAKGELYAATGPQGAVYRVDVGKNGAQEIFKPQATYIWALLPLPDGALIVATGLPGKVYRVEKGGASSVLWETQDSHVRALALGPTGKVLAGTAGSGLLVELDGKGGAYTLWDSERPEVVAIATDARGTIWAAFTGTAGKNEAAPGGARPPAKSGGTVNVTVKGRATADETLKPHATGDETLKPRATGDEDSGPPRPDEPAASRAVELPGGGGMVLRLGVGEEPESAWSDDKETPLALVARPEGGVLFGTAGLTPHVWWLGADGRLGLFDERKDVRAISALALGDGGRVIAATSNPAALVVYGPGGADPARWTSDVFDAKVRASLGHVHAFTTAPGVTVALRAGNTAEPDAGWTPWNVVPNGAAPADRDGGFVALPRARFAQVRIEFPAGARPAPSGADGVGRLVVHYRPQNRAPKIETVDALPRGVAFRSIPPAPMSGGEIPVVPPPRGPDLERALGETNPSWRSKRAYEPTALTVTWEARDPDNDELRYTVEYCRAQGATCAEWLPLADDLDQQFWSFDSRALPDGVYRFRVTADDAPGNALGEGRTVSHVSEPVAIDNAEPVIDRASYRARPDGRVDLVVEAHDPGGRLVKAEVSREPGTFLTLAAKDGVGDATVESWSGTLPAPKKGEELLVRVIDAAGNSTTKRAVAE